MLRPCGVETLLSHQITLGVSCKYSNREPGFVRQLRTVQRDVAGAPFSHDIGFPCGRVHHHMKLHVFSGKPRFEGLEDVKAVVGICLAIASRAAIFLGDQWLGVNTTRHNDWSHNGITTEPVATPRKDDLVVAEAD